MWVGGGIHNQVTKVSALFVKRTTGFSFPPKKILSTAKSFMFVMDPTPLFWKAYGFVMNLRTYLKMRPSFERHGQAIGIIGQLDVYRKSAAHRDPSVSCINSDFLNLFASLKQRLMPLEIALLCQMSHKISHGSDPKFQYLLIQKYMEGQTPESLTFSFGACPVSILAWITTSNFKRNTMDGCLLKSVLTKTYSIFHMPIFYDPFWIMSLLVDCHTTCYNLSLKDILHLKWESCIFNQKNENLVPQL